MPDVVRFIESDRAIKFAPQYLAEALGFFEEDGIVIRYGADAGPGGSALADRLVDAEADVALGGIWLPLLYQQLGVARLEPFARLCDRNPSVFLSRTDRPLEHLRDLTGARVLMSMAATSQWMFLSRVLMEQHVDLRSIKFVRDLDVHTTQRLWDYGYCDYYLVEPLRAVRLRRTGSRIAGTLANLCGRVPWSVYYAAAPFLDSGSAGEQPLAERYRHAVSRAVGWIQDAEPEKVASTLEDRFPSVATSDLADAVSLTQELGVWDRDLMIPDGPLRRYTAMMVDYGLLAATPGAAMC